MSNESSAGGGIGIGTIAMIVMVIIKATGNGLANWNWFAVISSIVWIPVGIAVIVIAVLGVVAALASIFNK
ncbi:MAG: hypothetical protein DRJ01_11145 [Bacteroidetes bacterium]|nr:MAG: hypothetical protein DRJ01_11145 [Bacteroidota bacterium]